MPLSVAPVFVIEVATPVVAVGGPATPVLVVKVWSDPVVVPMLFVATARK